MPNDEDLATLVRAAKKNRELTFGVLSDDVGNGYSGPIIGEFWRLAKNHGIRLIQFVERLTPEDIGGSRRLVTNLASTRCLDALLVSTIGPSLDDSDFTRYCERFKPLPICAIPDVEDDCCPQVGVDNASGMRQAALHLVEHHGYTEFGFVKGPEGNSSANLRLRVFSEVLESRGITLDPRRVIDGAFRTSDGVHAAELLFERNLVPRAIVCANDAMAFGVIEALGARGLRVPTDVAVIGYDDIDLCTHMDPPLTTVRQPLREQGRRSFEVLLKLLAHEREIGRLMLPSVLTVRESCGCGFAAPGHSNKPPSADSAQRRTTSMSLDEAVSALRELALDWPEGPDHERALVQAFVDEVNGSGPTFLPELQSTLAMLERCGRDVAPLQKLVTILWKRASASLTPASNPWHRADALLHGSRILIASVAERTQSIRQVRSEGFANKLSNTHAALSLTVDVDGVEDVLLTELPKYDIPSCIVCVYEPASSGDTARVLAGVHQGRRYSPTRPDAGEFPARDVLPSQLLRSPEMAECIVGPLARTGEAPGYAVFAKGPEDGFVYENLLAQLGATLSRLELLHQLITEAERREAAERERLEKELSIATRIQTGVLPRDIEVEGLEIAATMLPASEVGGDYYDVIRIPAGCWMGIGDVAGHGLPAGVVMLMLQSVVGGLCRMRSTASPSDLLDHANQVLFDNVRKRMGQDEHVTLTLLRYERGGRVVYAGAHEDLLVYRAASKTVEAVPTVGTWLAATPNIESVTENRELTLSREDVLLLHTDGVTEARNREGQRFGAERLATCFRALGERPVAAICSEIVAEVRGFSPFVDDDLTLLAARYLGT